MTASSASRRSGYKRFAAWLHDVALGAVVMGLALAVRYHFEGKPIPDHLLARSTGVFTAACAVVFPLFRLERGVWRFATLNDGMRIGAAVAVALMLTLPAIFWVDRLADFPRSVPLIVWPALTAAMALGRGLARARAFGDLRALWRIEDRSRPPTVVVGSPEAAAAFLTAARRRGMRPRVAGIVSTGEAEAGRTIHGAEVMGALPRLTSIVRALAAAEGPPPEILVAEARPTRALLDAVVAAAAETGAKLSRVRGGGSGADLAPVSAADLLDRPPRRLDAARAGALIAGRRVLVTGAGGTIGGELTRQILALGPEHLTLVDASEFNLYAIDQELRSSFPETPRVWTPVLADVRDEPRLREAFSRFRPQVVLHAAALKHVPLMEENPTEAVRTNIGGALIAARLARECAESFVFISTDKAVNPTNVMGATKRAAERTVRAVARGSGMRASVVRFGNVLGSTGSVAPLFERQIAEGGPVTVTHRDMERFFMTVQEAASLVLQAAALTDGDSADAGEDRVYVLDMGEPVRIDDLARQMIRLHGLKPDADIAIAYTGLRPGEKLYEEIFYAAEEVRPTGADGVLAAVDAAPEWSQMQPAVTALLAAAEAQDEAATLDRLQALVPAFARSTS